MTDDQQLISEARRRGVLSRMMNQGAGEPLWDALADALSTAAVRYRAEGWEEGVATALNHAIRNPDGITLRLEHLDGSPWPNPHRALLDENNETQED